MKGNLLSIITFWSILLWETPIWNIVEVVWLEREKNKPYFFGNWKSEGKKWWMEAQESVIAWVSMVKGSRFTL